MSSLRLWLSLVRFSHTFFALPFAIAGLLWGSQGLPSLGVFALVLGCMVTARNAAMAWNRLVDRDIDASNPRTAQRHIPAGLLTPNAVRGFVALNVIAFVGFAAWLNPLCLWLSPVALALVLGYSHLKRFTYLCHLGLGLAIGISPLAASIAATGEFALFPALLGLALWIWLAGFDIVYATQDEGFDRKAGLHSIPSRFGREKALRIALGLHLLVPAVLAYAGFVAAFGPIWWTLCGVILLVLLWIHFLRAGDDLKLGDGLFVANVGISFLVLAGVVLELFA
jgi:4-hydroxybenzoate polyprenyltransferase